ncbi:UNVERIFIED_CONTAM: hypothetical protein GTU68_013665 [Idotea baltica]|nr:hypothetical protein [Idotea baltica]
MNIQRKKSLLSYLSQKVLSLLIVNILCPK